MVNAVKVRFLKQIFEDDFPEKGMTANLTYIEWSANIGAYKLFFDFAEFEAENAKHFTESYWPNRITRDKVSAGILKEKDAYTAPEANYYEPQYSVYFSTSNPHNARDDAAFAAEIQDYLSEVAHEVADQHPV